VRPTALLSQARTWAVLGAAVFATVSVRRIGSPPPEAHMWRQVLGLGVGRAWLCGQGTFAPTVELCGKSAAPMAMEFPAYAYAGALLGRLTTPWVGARIVSIVGGCLAATGLGLITHRLTIRLGRIAALAACFAASLVMVASPVAQHWMAALLPDPLAWGLMLVSVGAALTLPTGNWPRLVGVSLAAGLGAATKLYAAPFVLASTFFVFQAWRGSTLRRRLAAAALHASLASLPSLLWYGVYNRHVLHAYPCQVFLVTTQRAALKTLHDPEIQAALLKYAGSILGPLLLLAIPGALVSLYLGGWKTLALVASTVGSLLVAASLGNHLKIHEYSVLFLVPLAALSVGTGVAMLARGAGERGQRLVAALTLCLVLGTATTLSADEVRARQAIDENAYVMDSGRDLNQVLDDTEGVLDNSWADPTLGYFSARRIRVLQGAQPSGDGCTDAEFDCGAILTGRTAPPCWSQHATAYVFFPNLEVDCGLQDPRGAFARILGHIRSRASRAMDPPLWLPETGLLVAIDYWLAPRLGSTSRSLVDFYVLVPAYGTFRTPREIQFQIADTPFVARGSDAPRMALGNTYVVLRATVPLDVPITHLHVPPQTAELSIEPRSERTPRAWECVRGRGER
jgi:hypothetical protein